MLQEIGAWPVWQQALTFLVGGLALIVGINVLVQVLVPRNKSLPPMVFHWVPVVGSAITYGMDPYRFFFNCREKYGDVFTLSLIHI